MPHHIIRSRIVQGVKPHELIAALMARENLGPLPLAKRMGYPKLQPQIHRFVRGEVAAPKAATAAPLAAYFKIPLEAIYDEKAATEAARALGIGEGLTPPRVLGSEPSVRTPPVTGAVQDVGPPENFSLRPARPVWVCGACQGGMPERIWDGDWIGSATEYAEVSTGDEQAFLCRVVGESMSPRYHPGEYVLIEPGTDPDLEDDVLVRLADGSTMLKRLLSRRNGWRFGSYNSTEVLNFRPDEVTWVYYVAHGVPARKIKQRDETMRPPTYKGAERRHQERVVPVNRRREVWHYDTEGKDYPPDEDTGQLRLAS